MDPHKHHQEQSNFYSLFCEEERWEEEEDELNEEDNTEINNIKNQTNPSLIPSLLLEQDLFWEDEELLSLFQKEKETHFRINNLESNPYLESARKEAVDWILRVISHYSFSALTASLSVNYLDRFLSSLHYQREKPWMIQLVAVACLSLAAKVEETQVPLLLDLQVEETKYLFEAKTIQRMELLVLSTLQWRMNPVTPFSFFDHIIRRFRLKNNLHWGVLQKCEHLLLLVLSDSRVSQYLPSVLATSIMLYVIDQVEPDNLVEYRNQLMGVLKTRKGEINDCYELILKRVLVLHCHNQSNKRKYSSSSIPGSPNDVIDVSFSSDSSNESWAVTSSFSSSQENSLLKKRKTLDQQMRLPTTFNRVVLNVLNHPR